MGQRQISRRPNPDTKCGVYICGRLNRKGGTIPEITLLRSTRYRPYPFRYPIPNLVSAPFWFHCASRVSGCPSSCSAGRLLHSTRRTISRVTRVQIPSRTPPFQWKIDGLVSAGLWSVQFVPNHSSIGPRSSRAFSWRANV